MRRILVVDDDWHVCLAIKAWLGRYGFAVADHGTAGRIALDNSIFDLMTLLGVINERLGTVASHCSYAAALSAVADALSGPEAE